MFGEGVEAIARPGNMSALTSKNDRNGVENDQKTSKIDRKTSKNDQKALKIDRKTESAIRRSDRSDAHIILVFPANVAPSASATTWHNSKNRTQKTICCKCPLQELFPPKSPIGNAWPRRAWGNPPRADHAKKANAWSVSPSMATVRCRPPVTAGTCTTRISLANSASSGTTVDRALGAWSRKEVLKRLPGSSG